MPVSEPKSKIRESEWIWKDGAFVPWEEAQVHLLSTAVQFGTSIFEGVRGYPTDEGLALFRLHDHLRRLVDSCRVYRMVPEHDLSSLVDACVQTVTRNRLNSCYLRPMVLRGYGAPGLHPFDSPIETWIAAFPWGTYLGEGALENGVDVCVSSWSRAAPNTYPMAAKAGGHYVNAQLMKMEAVTNGYADAIALGPEGRVSEGIGQNLFLVRDETLITPVLDGTSLAGITRHAVLQLADDLGIRVREQPVPRETLYMADELFFTGTAAEITPIRSVDRIQIGTGTMGPITKAIQDRFMDLVHGRIADPRGWRTLVPE